MPRRRERCGRAAALLALLAALLALLVALLAVLVEVLALPMVAMPREVDAGPLPTAATPIPVASAADSTTQAPDRQQLGDPRARFAAGNRAYEDGDYARAAAVYGSLAAGGYVSPALALNLGNALLRSGELGEAIAAYSHGLRLAPRDRDLARNLAYARSLTVDVVPETETSAFLEWLAGLLRLISAREAVLGAAALYWLTTLVVVLGRLLPARRRLAGRSLWVLLPLLGLASGLAAERQHAVWGSHAAVVLPSVVPVRSGPGDDHAGRFELHEGTQVRVRRAAGDWLEIELTEELTGWVPGTAVAGL